jgi:hypothetical protein
LQVSRVTFYHQEPKFFAYYITLLPGCQAKLIENHYAAGGAGGGAADAPPKPLTQVYTVITVDLATGRNIRSTITNVRSWIILISDS